MINGSDRFILDNNTNLTNGYGLFSCAHDYTSNGMHSSDTGNFSSPQPQESEFVLLNDGAHIDLWDSCWNNNGAKGKTRWVENAITLGHVHSTDEDGEGIEAMSATKHRQAALDNDYDTFSSQLPKDDDGNDFAGAEKLFKAVRKALGVEDDADDAKNENDDVDK